jgi:hypothetical protein
MIKPLQVKNMSKPVGGRGHTAPYKTTVVRIPVDIQERVEIIAEEFRDNLAIGIARVDLDNDKISKLSRIIDKYKLASKPSRDWTKCNQLIDELEAEIQSCNK